MELTYQSHDASGSMRKPLGAVGTGGVLLVVVTGSTVAVVDATVVAVDASVVVVTGAGQLQYIGTVSSHVTCDFRY